MIGLVAMLFSVSGRAQDQGIEFEHGSWSEALASAKAQDKLVFVDCFTDWCGPCKWMAANVMTDPEIGKLFNENFINVGMDMEKGEGIELAKKYQISAYPSLLFVDGDGELVSKAIGAKPIPDFLAMGEEAASGKIEPLGKLQRKFATGEYDREWLYNYLVRLSDAGIYDSLATEEFKQYMNNEGLLAADSWDVFKRIYRRTDTPQFLYVKDNLSKFEEKFGKEDVNQKLAQNYTGLLWQTLRNKDYDAYEKVRKDMTKLHLDNIDMILAQSDLQRYELELSPEKFRKKAASIVDKYFQDDAMMLNNVAWKFYESEHDAKLLAKALGWAERSVELEKMYANMDTYGFLLFKNGQAEKAREVLAEAIELAKASGEDYSATENDLKEWNERMR
jgi:thiol-disulfide isomerase/thioredoxin